MRRVLTRFALISFLFAPNALTADDDDSAWQHQSVALMVRVEQKNGSKFEGIVVNTARNQEIFPREEAVDPTTLPGDTGIRLDKFNGLSGSITLLARDVKRIEVLRAITTDELGKSEQQVKLAKEARWTKELDRLRRVNEARQARDQAEVDAAIAAEEAAAGAPKLPASLQAWIDRFPPTEGWVPAKKAQLYYQTYILDTHKPTDREREWLDQYDSWKGAYDAWLKLEQDKISAAAAAQAAGTELGAGASGEPSKTAGTNAAKVDPDSPTDDEKNHLLPDYQDKQKPDAIESNVPRPDALKDKEAGTSGAPTPVPLGGGN